MKLRCIFFNECKNLVLIFRDDVVVINNFILDFHLDIFAPLFEEVSNNKEDDKVKVVHTANQK